ncbi:hypothetical protein [Janibacter corallicola]|uniref:hypothetical protein n=1 Tax=Janibacter corallicola TaxID=415212 RepID=UPI0008318618|nr:hypothetical protein [Janibacter corallicola]
MRAPRVRAAAALAAFLVSAGAVSACSDAPSDGWKRLEGDRLTLEVPQGFTEGEGASEKWNLAVRDDGVSVQVADPYDNSRILSSALGNMQFAANRQMEGFTPGKVQDIEVEGADTALFQEFSYKDEGKPATGAWIAVGQSQPPTTVIVTVSGTEADDDLITHVKDSLEYEHSDVVLDTDGKPVDES